MKRQLCICFALLSNLVLQAQAPKGPDGNSLYKKGDCERAGVNFNVCTYCEDKELTKNCKEYWCTDNGTCTPAPKESPKATLTKSPENIATKLKETDTTSKLPKGTKFENGKVVVVKGFKAVYSSNKKMVAIVSGNGPGISGTIICNCDPDKGSGLCRVTIEDNSVGCVGDDCCTLFVALGDGANLTMEKIEKAPEKLKWKKLIFPIK